ncbi:MAG: lysozyme inhibitor LprI family protein, partial [Methylocella sp.]
MTGLLKSLACLNLQKTLGMERQVMTSQPLFSLHQFRQVIPSALIGIAVCMWFVSAGLAEAPCAGQGPSFDCAKAHSAVEIAICRSPNLACLDAQLASTYKDAFTRFAYALKDVEKHKQLVWLSQRGSCVGNEDCLEKMYRQRLAELSAFAGPLSRDSSGPQNNSRDGAFNGLNMSDRRRLTEERQKNLSQFQGSSRYTIFRDCEC